MRLFFQKTYLGEIGDLFFDQPEVHGAFSPASEIDDYQRLFRWMADEDNSSKEPPFDDDLLNDDNRFVIDDAGQTRGITLPGVYDYGEIIWRWRDNQ